MFGFLKRMFGGGQQPEPSADCLVPRIKNQNFLPALKEHGIPDDQLPITEPLVGDLLVTYAFDLPHTFQMVMPNDCSELGIPLDKARRIAIRNMARSFPPPDIQSKPPIYSLIVGSDMEACLLLVDELWKQLDERVPGQIVAAVPARDVMLYTSSESEEGLAAIKKIAAEVFAANDVHGLTEQLLTWKDGKWAVFEAT
ncbi:MAG: DUF1444 family protein [Pirellulales bacterium]|nr:DUF1444 family protein [Pirellulales bacterium]